MGREIAVEAEDGSFGAYLAEPEDSGPGVLVVQEWWGLVDSIRGVCDRLARAGFTALAPDLYRGARTSDPDEAARLMLDLEIPRAARDLAAAGETLARVDSVCGAKLGCIGFCMGGQLALAAAAGSARIGAVVDCYGVHPNVEVDFGAISAPVLGVFAERDEYVPPDAVRALQESLEAAGVRSHCEVYAGVDHAFLNEARPEVYAPEAAARAWSGIESFLRAELPAT